MPERTGVDEPDVITELTGLRTALEGVVTQPDLDVVVPATRRRRRNRTLRTGAVAAVAAAVLAVVVPLQLFGGDADAPPAGPATDLAELLPGRSFFAQEVEFAGQRGSIVLHTCSRGLVDKRCDYRMAVTTDRGETWQVRDLPLEDTSSGTRDHAPKAYLLGEDAIVLNQVDGDGRWLSTDGGENWDAVPQAAEGSVDTVPEDAALGFRCAGVETCGEFRPIVIRHDGTSAWLAQGRPAGLDMTKARQAQTGLRPYAATDGSLWLTGDQPYVSRDRGRTWAAVRLPAPGTLALSTVDGNVVYAVVYGGSAQSVWRSTDGARSWQRLPVPDGIWTAVPTADGGALLADERTERLMRLDAGPTAAADADVGLDAARMVRPAGDGIFATASDGSYVGSWVSPDGEHWIKASRNPE